MIIRMLGFLAVVCAIAGALQASETKTAAVARVRDTLGVICRTSPFSETDERRHGHGVGIAPPIVR
jgi:hypothetical protein